MNESDVMPADAKVQIVEALEQPLQEAAGDDLDAIVAALPVDQQDEVRSIYDEGTLRGFQGAILAGGIVALFGALLAFWLPKVKLESDASVDSTVKEVVCNPTIAKLQFEMDDL